jgi:hypothetical protein
MLNKIYQTSFKKMLTSSGSNASVMSNVTSLPTATAKLLYIFGFLVEIK